MRNKNTQILLSLAFAVVASALLTLPAFASTPYSHPDVATGQQINPASGAVDYIRFAVIRGAPRKSQATNCVGATGMLYHKIQRADGASPYTDELRTCVAGQTVPDWSSCTQGLAYQRTRGVNDQEIVGADMALGNYGRVLVAWIESSGATPNVTVKYYARLSSDNGATWGAVTEIGSYTSNSFAHPYDIDVAANDAGDLGVTVYLDQSADSANQTIIGQPSGDWLSVVKYKAAWPYTMSAYSVLDNANSPDHFYGEGSELFDLVGGGGDGMFHTLYSQNRDFKVKTNYTYGSFTRTLLADTDSIGVLPRGTKSYFSIATLAHQSVHNVAHTNSAPALKTNLSNLYFISGNEFSNWQVLQSPMLPGMYIAIHTLSPAGVISPPIYPVNDPLALPRCADNMTNVGAQCSELTHAINVDARPTIGELGALVGNTYYIPALVTDKTWDSGAGRYWDTSQRVIVAAHNLGFGLSCPQPPLPRCMKKGQKNCIGMEVNAVANVAAY